MNPEELKEKVREAFAAVECGDFLRKKVEHHKKMLAEDYEAFKKRHDGHCLGYYKELKTKFLNYNTTNSDELSTIGFHLIALEEFNPEN